MSENRKEKLKKKTGLELKQIEEDLKEVYEKIVDELKTKTEYDRNDITKINLILAIKKDKQELMKFVIEQDRKERELRYKYDPNSTDVKKLMNSVEIEG